MSNMSRLAAELDELRRCGEILIGISGTLREMFSGGVETAAKELEKQLTLADVRAVLAEKSRAGHTAEVRALLTRHGADRLSEVPESEYAALLADAETIGNPGKPDGLLGRGGTV